MVMESNDSLHNSLSDTYDDKLSSELQKKINYLNRHFIYFAVVASLNHALAYVVLAYASSLLDPELAGIILSLTWFLNAVSGFTVATFITRYLGYKIAMIISLTGYTIQIYTLYLSVLYPTLAWHVAITGAIISGFTSAIWWTAQGICFELTCQQLCQLYDADAYNLKQKQEQQHFFKPFEDSNIKLLPLNVISNINVVRSNLSAIWTLVYQIADIVVFLVLSIAPLYFNMTFVETLNCLVILGIITSILGLTFDSLGDKGTPMSPSQIMTSIISVPRQFQSDARASLLAPFVFGFGITTAMFAFFINGTIENTEPTIGLNHMGLLESYSYLVAVIVAFPYAYICTQYKHGSNFVIQFGSFSFMMCGIVSIMVNDKQISTWQCLLVLRTLYGMGRSVFEGVYVNKYTCKKCIIF